MDTRYRGFRGVDAGARIGQIMLRFRPIAPKPTAAPASSSADDKGHGDVVGAKERRKKGGGAASCCCSNARRETPLARRVARGRRKKSTTMATPASSTVEDAADEGCSSMGHAALSPPAAAGAAGGDLITLPLMPERPVGEGMAMGSQRPAKINLAAATAPPAACSFQQQQQQLVGSVVKVELVAEEEMVEVDGGARMWLCWCGEEEARKGLYWDEWPAFISDAWERVTWTNPAYRRMVGVAAEGGMVLLLPDGEDQKAVLHRKAFTCWATVKYYASCTSSSTIAAPCDVRRLSDGGLAWRLDVDAALSLSR